MSDDQNVKSWKSSTKSFPFYLLIVCIIGTIAATFLLASVPPVSRDALTHHLFVPKLWLQHGGIYEIPEIPFSYYPMNLDLLYMIPLSFGNDIIPKYIHYLFALLTALLVFRYLTKNLGRQYGLLGALFFLSIPIIVKLSITVYVDLGVVFFSTASLLLLLHWAEKQFLLRFLLLAGLCCGLAAGTKYNGLVAIVILTLFVPIIYQQSAAKEQRSNRKAALYGVIFAVAALISFSPWLIRNYAWTGNPIYPLHNSLFQKFKSINTEKQPDVTEEITDTLQQFTSQGSSAFVIRKTIYNEPWWQILLLPLRLFYEGQDDNPRFFDGKLTPYLLLLPLLVFFAQRRNEKQRREQKILLFFAILYFFLTFLQESTRIRYIVPIIPTLVILSMYGVQGISLSLSERIKGIGLQKAAFFFMTICIPCLMLGYNAKYIFDQFALVKPLPYLLGQISREQYITAFRPEYPAIQYANTHLPPNSKVLCVFLGNRGYYMDFRPVFEIPFGSGLFSTFLNKRICDKDSLVHLRKQNITHILLRNDLTLSWFQRLPPQDQTCITSLLNNASTPLFSQNGYTFFQI